MRFGREHEVRLRVAKALRDLGLTVKAVQKAITTAPIALLEKRLASLSPEASPEQVGEILEELWRLPNLAAPAYQTLVGHVARGEALHRAHYYAEGSPSQWERATLAPGVELHFQRPDDERREAVIRHIILDAQKRLSVFD
jgi:DNA-binding transcriptional MerR regulator